MRCVFIVIVSIFTVFSFLSCSNENSAERLPPANSNLTSTVPSAADGQESLVNKRNLKKKNGDLVVEVVCANAVTDKKAKEACTNYSNTIPLPKVGDRVTVTGSYVNDSHNGWMEIHPVSSIQVRR